MAENQDNNQNSVRVLQKVRSEFINRTADQDETIHPDQMAFSKVDCQAHIIDPHIGIAEVDGHIVLGAQFLNDYFFVNSVRVEQHPNFKTVALNLQKKEEEIETPWKSIVEWLESTGDIELNTWAQKIAQHYTTFPQIMAKYFELVSSGDPKIYANLRKAKSRAVLACREIESKYQYLRLVLFSNKEAITPLSVGYSEQLVKMMGHDIESFTIWAKNNGIPKVSAGNTIGHKDICKSFLECISFSEGPVWEGPEFQSFVYAPDGSKQDQVIQFFSISEPTRDGLFITNYHIMKAPDEKVNLASIAKTENDDALTKEDLDTFKSQEKQQP